MAQANAQIGIARAAYFPTVTLSAAAGLESTSITKLVHLAEPLFLGRPGGRRNHF